MQRASVLVVLVALVALLAAGGCAARRERQLESAFDEARLASRRGDLPQARALTERGIALAAPDSEWSWSFRLLRGEILLLQHQSAEVESLVQAPMPPGLGFAGLRARQQFLRALVQRSQNHFADAFALLEAAGRIAPGDDPAQLDIAWLQGQLLMRLGRWSEAETRLNAVVTNAAAAGDRFQQARALNDLGMGSVARNRWDEALPRFEQVLSFQDLDSLSVYGAALSNAGICYSRLGEFDHALAIQRRSVALHTNRGPRADYAQSLAGLGNTFIMQGDARQGLPFLRQALELALEIKQPADAALWAGNIAAANVELGNWNEAERFNEQAKALKAASRTGQLAHNTLNAAQIAQGRGQFDQAASLFEESLAGGGADPAIRWSAHAGLGDVAMSQSHAEEASRHFEAALETIEKTRSDLLKTEYKFTFLTRLIHFYQEYVEVLVGEGRTDRALEVSESSRGRVLADRNGLPAPAKASAAALRQVAARSGTVLLSYWLAPRQAYVWVVTAESVRCVRLPPADDVLALVKQYQATVNNSLADPLGSATAGGRLYQMLVEPVSAWVPRGARVVIAADGALHGLNFESLPVPGATRHYWIQDAEIEVTPGLSVLSVIAGRPAPAASMLLIGDATPRPPEFPALKYAGAEILNVARHFPADAVVTFQAGRASPAAYKSADTGAFTFVHFAAHAASNFASPLDSAVILTGPDGGYKLYARDVAALPLHAELVTVSACRGAGERAYSGEGLVGFAWAFLRAGAHRVIAGLWDVDDRSTAELMDRLYSGIAAGKTVSGSLREAKLAMIARSDNYSKPYYWAPFQLFTVVP
ncbi:MAG: CHAT domain-containing protein [Acidobacteriota bacterium]